MITFRHKGDFDKTEKFFKRSLTNGYLNIFEHYGREGVDALSSMTPLDTGKTASRWSYRIVRNKNGVSITWYNSNVVNGVQIAVILQYGHGTRNGGYVQGRDYINPAIQPIFDKMSENIWREVTKK